MGAVAGTTDYAIALWLPSHAIQVLALRVVASIGVALFVLDRAARALHVHEFTDARGLLMARLARMRTRA